MPSAADMLAHMTANVARVAAGEAPVAAPWQGTSPNAGLKNAAAKEPDGYVTDPQAPVAAGEATPEGVVEPAAAEPESAAAPARDASGKFVPKLVEPKAKDEAPADEPRAETAAESADRIAKLIVDGEEVTDAEIRELKQFRLQALRGETQAQIAKREADAKMQDVMAKFEQFNRDKAQLAQDQEHVDELWRTAKTDPNLFMQLAQADGSAPAPARQTTNAPQAGKFLTPEDLNKVLDDREKAKEVAASEKKKIDGYMSSVNGQITKLAAGDPALELMMRTHIASWETPDHNGVSHMGPDFSPEFIAASIKEAHKRCSALLAQRDLAARKAAPKKIEKAPPPSPQAGGTPIAGKEAPTSDPRELMRRVNRALALQQTQRPAPARI